MNNMQLVYARGKVEDLDTAIGDSRPTLVQQMLKSSLNEVLLEMSGTKEYDIHMGCYLRILGALVDFDGVMTRMEATRVIEPLVLCWYLVTVQNMIMQLYRMADTDKRMARFAVVSSVDSLMKNRVHHPVFGMWLDAQWASDDFLSKKR